jgi:hypothetical protein
VEKRKRRKRRKRRRLYPKRGREIKEGWSTEDNEKEERGVVVVGRKRENRRGWRSKEEVKKSRSCGGTIVGQRQKEQLAA